MQNPKIVQEFVTVLTGRRSVALMLALFCTCCTACCPVLPVSLSCTMPYVALLIPCTRSLLLPACYCSSSPSIRLYSTSTYLVSTPLVLTLPSSHSQCLSYWVRSYSTPFLVCSLSHLGCDWVLSLHTLVYHYYLRSVFVD